MVAISGSLDCAHKRGIFALGKRDCRLLGVLVKTPHQSAVSLGHRRTRTRSSQVWIVGLVAVAVPVSIRTIALEHGTVHSVGRLAGPDLFRDVRHAFKNARRLINVIADALQLR